MSNNSKITFHYFNECTQQGSTSIMSDEFKGMSNGQIKQRLFGIAQSELNAKAAIMIPGINNLDQIVYMIKEANHE